MKNTLNKEKINNLFTFRSIKIVANDEKNYKITIKKLRKFAFFHVFCKTVRKIATNRRFFANFYCTSAVKIAKLVAILRTVLQNT